MTEAKTFVTATTASHTTKRPRSRGETPARNVVGTTPVSATPMGPSLIGYARVSTPDQSTDRQHTALIAAGCARVFEDVGTGSTMARPGLDAALAYVRAGDTLVVEELSRLGRTTIGVLDLARDLEARSVSLRILGLGVDTGTPTGKLTLTILAAVAEMERSLLIERTRSGLAEARRQGRVGGRPPALTEDQRALARRLISEGRSYRTVARMMGTSARTVQRAVAEVSTD